MNSKAVRIAKRARLVKTVAGAKQGRPGFRAVPPWPTTIKGRERV